ncbi:putative class iii [Erysiphe necator]|uniref:chitinase n=1 Tax=Uncinula necator TaxID=52586 RepID=A0A0B1P251_UNCNE|nr:putative class iii [Erysiphe necator]
MLIQKQLILISFLTNLKEQVVNFASATDVCQPINGTTLVYCPEIEEDIIKCQTKFGKTILLSIGGSTYSENGFSSMEAANIAADKVWANFGPLTEDVSVTRPFGKAVVDGFDLDIETQVLNMVPFVRRLLDHLDISRKSDSRKFFLTATPQCPFPDTNFGPLFDGSIYFDAIWVQFYNNYCGADKFIPGSASQPFFNFATWNDWAQRTFPNQDVNIMLGISGGEKATRTGNISKENTTALIEYSNEFPSFGGVMIWEMTALFNNENFLETVSAVVKSNEKKINSDLATSLPASSQQNSSPEVTVSSDASAIHWFSSITWILYISIFLALKIF